MSVEQSFTEAGKAHYERAKQIKVNAIVELAETMTYEELFAMAEKLKRMAGQKMDAYLDSNCGTGNE